MNTPLILGQDTGMMNQRDGHLGAGLDVGRNLFDAAAPQTFQHLDRPAGSWVLVDPNNKTYTINDVSFDCSV